MNGPCPEPAYAPNIWAGYRCLYANVYIPLTICLLLETGQVICSPLRLATMFAQTVKAIQ